MSRVLSGRMLQLVAMSLALGTVAAGGMHARAAAQATAAASPAPAAVRAVAIDIKGFAFAPRAITIAAGTTVTWRNLDAEPHTVRGADELPRSGALDQDETYSVRFDKPGTYRYGCSIHPQMSGTIIVQ